MCDHKLYFVWSGDNAWHKAWELTWLYSACDNLITRRTQAITMITIVSLEVNTSGHEDTKASFFVNITTNNIYVNILRDFDVHAKRKVLFIIYCHNIDTFNFVDT